MNITSLYAASVAGVASDSNDSWLTKGFWFETWMGERTGSSLAHHTDSMMLWLWWFCVVWFVGLMGLMFYFVLKYRRRPGRIAERSVSHNSKLEVFWTIIPTLFLVWIFWEGMRGYVEKMVAPPNAMELKLTGYKWSWDMEYPGGTVVNRGSSAGLVAEKAAEAIPVFYIPAKTPIRLRMNSSDVMHSFWIPSFRIKQDLVPNRFTGMYFEAKALDTVPTDQVKYHPKTKAEAKWDCQYVEGLGGKAYVDYWIFCAEYCGTGHSEMAGIIRVVDPADYKVWLADQTNPSTISNWEKGQRIYKARCSSCHTIDGSGSTGPSWKNLYGYEHSYTDGSKIVADDNHILESIRLPNKHIRADYPGGGMTAFPENLVSNQQVGYIIEYMKKLSDKAPQTEAAPADAKPADAKAADAKPAEAKPAAGGGH